MKTIWIVLCGIGAAAGYVALSFALSGEGGFSLAIILGTVIGMALSGIRTSSAASVTAGGAVGRQVPVAGDQAEREIKVEGQGSEDGDQGSEIKQDNLTSCAATQHNSEQETARPAQRKEEIRLSSSSSDLDSSPVPSQPQSPISADSSTETPEALWKRARVMVHNVIPDSEEDAEYLRLIYSAAEQGYVPALAKLGDYAFRRGAFVEAYFWTKIAKRRLELASVEDPQGLKEIDVMLTNIRCKWTAAGRPPEFENVYDSFPEERGELGRAFLRLDGGIEVGQTREYVRLLAGKGNPDAALFVGHDASEKCYNYAIWAYRG